MGYPSRATHHHTLCWSARQVHIRTFRVREIYSCVVYAFPPVGRVLPVVDVNGEGVNDCEFLFDVKYSVGS